MGSGKASHPARTRHLILNLILKSFKNMFGNFWVTFKCLSIKEQKIKFKILSEFYHGDDLRLKQFHFQESGGEDS